MRERERNIEYEQLAEAIKEVCKETNLVVNENQVRETGRWGERGWREGERDIEYEQLAEAIREVCKETNLVVNENQVIYFWLHSI